MHARKIYQLLTQEEGCTLEDLLAEEEGFVSICKSGSTPKLIDFVCQRDALKRLIQYAVQYPQDTENHTQSHK